MIGCPDSNFHSFYWDHRVSTKLFNQSHGGPANTDVPSMIEMEDCDTHWLKQVVKPSQSSL